MDVKNKVLYAALTVMALAACHSEPAPPAAGHPHQEHGSVSPPATAPAPLPNPADPDAVGKALMSAEPPDEMEAAGALKAEKNKTEVGFENQIPEIKQGVVK